MLTSVAYCLQLVVVFGATGFWYTVCKHYNAGFNSKHRKQASTARERITHPCLCLPLFKPPPQRLVLKVQLQQPRKYPSKESDGLLQDNTLVGVWEQPLSRRRSFEENVFRSVPLLLKRAAVVEKVAPLELDEVLDLLDCLDSRMPWLLSSVTWPLLPQAGLLCARCRR